MMAGIAMVALALSACTQPQPAADHPVASAEAKGAAMADMVPAASSAPAQKINAARALQYLKDVVAFGPRPVGSPGHKKLQAYLRAHLKSGHLEEDAFTAHTPAGPLPMRNFIAKFPGTKDGIIVIAGHYDTPLPLKKFVGANDGGSSTALLLELANQLRARNQGHSVWLVWFDGEEAIREWTPDDSLYGSRHLAEKWEKDGTLRNIKAFVLLDMVGDSDLNIEAEANSTPWLRDLVAQAAARLGYRSHFFARELAIEDDHIPFLRRGVPAIDLIDYEYGYANALWHTQHDTLDKVSAKSLEIVGNVVLETVRLVDGR